MSIYRLPIVFVVFLSSCAMPYEADDWQSASTQRTAGYQSCSAAAFRNEEDHEGCYIGVERKFAADIHLSDVKLLDGFVSRLQLLARDWDNSPPVPSDLARRTADHTAQRNLIMSDYFTSMGQEYTKAQQQNADAGNLVGALLFGMAEGYAARPQPTILNCSSVKTGNTVQTTCF